MTPSTLFDKSFLQSLSVDESVWFDRFFRPVISPVFYAETLAGLAKEPKPGTVAESTVRAIADKFPEMTGAPCADHRMLCLADLERGGVPMDGRIPMAGGWRVRTAKHDGVLFDHSPEAQAFQRWQSGNFQELERTFASSWREAVRDMQLGGLIEYLRSVGLDGQRFKSFEALWDAATQAPKNYPKRFEILRTAAVLFEARQEAQRRIIERWRAAGQPELASFAPYAAYVIGVEIFFQLALAAGLISAERPSNRLDIAYLFYLPFSELFVSSDNLHRRCAPALMRSDQEFVWGPDLKADLKRLNAHYLELPEEQRRLGIMRFAHMPPPEGGFLVSQLWDRGGLGWRTDKPIENRSPEKDRRLVEQLKEFAKAPRLPLSDDPVAGDDVSMLSIERKVGRRKGSWWQIPPAEEGFDPDKA